METKSDVGNNSIVSYSDDQNASEANSSLNIENHDIPTAEVSEVFLLYNVL